MGCLGWGGWRDASRSGVEGAGDGQGHSVAGSPGSVTRTRLLVSIYGDREGERRTHPDLALDPDLAAVQFHELPTQGQSQAGALDLLVGVPIWRNSSNTAS